MNFASILDCSQDAQETAAETASDEVVRVDVRALCEFSVLVSRQNPSVLSLKALDNAVKQFYLKEGIF